MARATTVLAKARKRNVGRIGGATKILPTSKEELRARIEKLERANANLRIKNKEFRRLAEDAAERLESLQTQIESTAAKLARPSPVTTPTEPARKRPSAKVPKAVVNHEDDSAIDGFDSTAS